MYKTLRNGYGYDQKLLKEEFQMPLNKKPVFIPRRNIFGLGFEEILPGLFKKKTEGGCSIFIDFREGDADFYMYCYGKKVPHYQTPEYKSWCLIQDYYKKNPQEAENYE